MSYSIDSERRGNLLVVCGASGSGKSTLARHALGVFSKDLRYMNTYTTRSRRFDEDDIEYTFVDEDQYAYVRDKAVLWDESYIYGNYYGLDPAWYLAELSEGRNFIVCTVPDNALVDPMIDLYEPSGSVKMIYIKMDRRVSEERIMKRKIERDLSRIAIDAAMLENKFRADFIFTPSGDLECDKERFNAVIGGILYE